MVLWLKSTPFSFLIFTPVHFCLLLFTSSAFWKHQPNPFSDTEFWYWPVRCASMHVGFGKRHERRTYAWPRRCGECFPILPSTAGQASHACLPLQGRKLSPPILYPLKTAFPFPVPVSLHPWLHSAGSRRDWEETALIRVARQRLIQCVFFHLG